MNYLVRNRPALLIRREGSTAEVPSKHFVDACIQFNTLVDKFEDFGVDVFALLGMRNLSAFIGELYGSVVIRDSNGLFRKNPHQDGYPDLLLMDVHGHALWDSLAARHREKGPFSPFLTGGIEIKATCGAVPAPAALARRGFTKPGMGEERIAVLTGYDWKAHHQKTNNLFGLVWDFVEKKPRIVAGFYSDALTTDDWGDIVQPREGGGNTTSVSIMRRHGVAKMYKDWLFVLDDSRYTRFFDKFNGSNVLTSYHKASSAPAASSKATPDETLLR